jgi:2-keto-3-deoxy-L-fuconate dehydrogenase
MAGRLEGKRVLVTHAERYMGPPIVELFRAEGAQVVADTRELRAGGEAEAAVGEAGALDVLVANLAESNRPGPVGQIRDEDWAALFEVLVHPLMRLVRAAAPGMVARGAGKVVAITSAAPLKGVPGFSAYCAARGAQNAFVRAVGLELARHNVQVNAIAQNFVENVTYYPPEVLADAAERERLLKRIPARRFARGVETAELALFLASPQSDFIVGQVVPFAGGWVTTG